MFENTQVCDFPRNDFVFFLHFSSTLLSTSVIYGEATSVVAQPCVETAETSR
jgi:hypothetical protein